MDLALCLGTLQRMTIKMLAMVSILAVTLNVYGQSENEYSTSPLTAAEIEAAYTTSIEVRAVGILDALELEDADTAATVHDVIIAQYRALRARDSIVDQNLIARGKETSFEDSERAAMVRPISEHLGELYLTTLSAYLTPEQVEIVQDQMTYNRVQAIYDEYCAILPYLKETDKARILERLKTARSEAIGGGSRNEKFSIFDHCKQQIDQQLSTNGYDVAKARKEWETKQSVAGRADSESDSSAN